MAELEEADFLEHDDVPSEIFRKPPAAHVPYVVGMAQLAKLCEFGSSYSIECYLKASSTGGCLQPIFTRSHEPGQCISAHASTAFIRLGGSLADGDAFSYIYQSRCHVSCWHASHGL